MIRGTKRALVSEPDTGTPNKNKIDLALMAKIHNRWDVEVVDAATGEVKQRARGFNVICNYWWQVIPNASSNVNYLHYGRGTGTPAATDTALFSRIGYKGFNSSSFDASTLDQGFVSWQYLAQLAPADAVGETITEVGLAASTTSGLLTHAMLEDMNGNPISITKTATDIVNIYATVFLHLTTDRYANGKIRISTQVSWMRGPNMSSSYQGVRLCQTSDQNTNSAFVRFSSKNYSSSTKTMSIAFAQATVSDANYAGGLLMMIFGKMVDSYYGYEAWLIMFPASKSQIINESIGTGNGTTQNFRTKFAFPSEATIYVDGVAQTSGVTVRPDHRSQSARLDRFLAPIAFVTTPDKLVIFDNFVATSWKYIAGGAELITEKLVDGLVIDWLVFSGATASGNVTIYASDDLETWTDVGSTMSSSEWWTIPAPYNAAKYYKIKNNKGSNITLSGGARSGYDGYAIRFDTPPAAGAVITADYKTPMIPKDDNHLMDISMTVTFGEYTGEEI